MPTLIENIIQFENVVAAPKLSVIHFSADFAEQCAQINNVLDELSNQEYKSNEVNFCSCPAEKLSEAALKYKIEAVPTVVLFRNGEEVDRINGADPAQVTAKVKQYASITTTSPQPLEERLKKLINRNHIMLFMKGNPEHPRCLFSTEIIQILKDNEVAYEYFDILQDEEVRQGLKTYSDWPTYPQLYIKGELVGGVDTVKQLIASGELASLLKTQVGANYAEDNEKAYIKRNFRPPLPVGEHYIHYRGQF